MFINVSNHSSKKWNEKQIEQAKKYGDIIDIPFPVIDPSSRDEEINHIVNEYFDLIMQYQDCVVMLQGEYIFTYRLVNKLKQHNIKVLASCSERRTIEYVDDNGFTSRKSEFEFVEFKEY